jgi:hypothetical protein
MLYFGTEDIGMSTTEEEVTQLLRVVRFRERLQSVARSDCNLPETV